MYLLLLSIFDHVKNVQIVLTTSADDHGRKTLINVIHCFKYNNIVTYDREWIDVVIVYTGFVTRDFICELKPTLYYTYYTIIIYVTQTPNLT